MMSNTLSVYRKVPLIHKTVICIRPKIGLFQRKMSVKDTNSIFCEFPVSFPMKSLLIKAIALKKVICIWRSYNIMI